MKLIFLLVASLTLSASLVNGGRHHGYHDRNFVVSYGLSSFLERTGFSQVLAKSFNITGRAKYLHYNSAIDEQLISMMYESLFQLPPDVLVKMVNKTKEMLDKSLPMVEKYEPALMRDLDQKLKQDVSKLSARIQRGIKRIDDFVKETNASDTQTSQLEGLSRFIKWADSYIAPEFNASSEYSLKETIFSLIDIVGKLPKLRSLRRSLCPIVMDKHLFGAISASLLTKDFFIFNFRSTLKFIQDVTVRHMIKSYLRAYPVRKMMEHFSAVLSNKTVAAITNFYKKNGQAIFEDKLRLMLALMFRPKGTFTQLKDFLPYMRSLVRAVHSLPEDVKKMLPFSDMLKKFNNTDISALIEKMKSPNAIMKSCLGMLKLIPKDVLQKLKARPGFESDAKNYCHMVESYDRFYRQIPNQMLSALQFLEMKFGIPKRCVNSLKATFTPGNIHFIGYIGDNPKAFYKRLLSKGAKPRIMKTVARTRGMFRFILHRVKIMAKVMFGKSACKDYAPRSHNSTDTN